jgi:phosphoglycolate phosphatase
MSALIMFDFDGVIVDSLDEQSRACTTTLHAHGLPHLATHEQFLAFTDDNWFTALADAGVPGETVRAIEDAIAATPSPPLFAGVASVLEELARENPVVVISSSRTSVVERILAEHGVQAPSEVVGGDGEQSKTRKIRRVCARHGHALPAWYVGDTVGDIFEARAAGVGTVGAAWGWHGERRLRRADPDHMALTPGDLLQLF